MNGRAQDPFKTLLQVLAVLGLALIWTMVVHKGYVDISVIAAKHSGMEFWRAVAVYLLRNLAGGGPPAAPDLPPAPPL